MAGTPVAGSVESDPEISPPGGLASPPWFWIRMHRSGTCRS